MNQKDLKSPDKIIEMRKKGHWLLSNAVEGRRVTEFIRGTTVPEYVADNYQKYLFLLN